MDHLSKKDRSKLMSKIRGKDTKPELFVRRLVSSKGLRYRLHVKKLPGTPDIVFSRLKKMIFVNGCFWHGHYCRTVMPKTNSNFWVKKIKKNKRRDASN